MPKLIVADLSQTTGCTTNYAPWGAWPCRWFGAAWGLQTSSFAAAETKHGSAVFVPHLISPVQPMGLSEERCNQCNLEICTRGWKFLRAKCQGTKFVYIGGRYQNCHLHYTGRRKPFTWLEFQVEPLAGPSCSEIFRSRAEKRQAGRGDWSIGDCRCRWLLQFWHCLADIDTCDFKAKLSDLGAALMTLRKPCFWMFLIPPIFWRSSVGFSKSYCRSFWWQRWW